MKPAPQACLSRAAVLRTPGPPPSLPAIWAAFVRQAQWKTWALILSFGLNFLLAVAAIGFADRRPDVVLVEPSGKSTYVAQGVVGDALVRFLEEQRLRPSDVTVVHFTTFFLTNLLAVNSSTIETTWAEALTVMSPPLRERMASEASQQKLIETYRLARVRTELAFEDVELVERHGDMLHVRARVRRTKGSIDSTGPSSQDRLRVDLVQRVVPRTAARPDGLEVVEYRNQVLTGVEGVAGGDDERMTR